MTAYYYREFEKLKEHLLNIGGQVEASVISAVEAFLKQDVDLANEVIQTDHAIDQQEVELEEECLKVLALYQPLAMDLRFVASVLKINNDLERIGDISVNIARKALYISRHPHKLKLDFDYSIMAKKAQIMLHQSLDAFIHRDADLAYAICQRDQEVNDMKKSFKKLIIEAMKKHCDLADVLIRHHALTRHLERIADMATNIAEEVIYMVTGEIRRHILDTDYMEDQDGQTSV